MPAETCPPSEPVSGGEEFSRAPRFGEDETVVRVVVAVGGLSADVCEMAAPDEGGNLPVNSNFLIRDFRSSNSSHTVEVAVVEEVEFVSVARDISRTAALCRELPTTRSTRGDESYDLGVPYK